MALLFCLSLFECTCWVGDNGIVQTGHIITTHTTLLDRCHPCEQCDLFAPCQLGALCCARAAVSTREINTVTQIQYDLCGPHTLTLIWWSRYSVAPHRTSLGLYVSHGKPCLCTGLCLNYNGSCEIWTGSPFYFSLSFFSLLESLFPLSNIFLSLQLRIPKKCQFIQGPYSMKCTY